MIHAATCRSIAVRRRRRAFFLRRTTQHVRSLDLLREAARAAVALGGLAGWTGVLLVLAG